VSFIFFLEKKKEKKRKRKKKKPDDTLFAVVGDVLSIVSNTFAKLFNW
jgi:hypothetical protein